MAINIKKKDYEKMWQDAKKQLFKISKDTLDLLKKGEEGIIKVSGKARINFEIMLLKLKKEQLFYIIGKESIKSIKKNNKISNPTVTNIIKQVKEIEKQIAANKKLLRKKS